MQPRHGTREHEPAQHWNVGRSKLEYRHEEHGLVSPVREGVTEMSALDSIAAHFPRRSL